MPPRRLGSSLEALTELLDLRPSEPRSGVPSTRAELGVVAGRSGPRFLVPLDFPDASPEACLAYLGLRDLKTRASRGAVGWAFKAHLGGLVARERLTADAGPGSLIGLLAELLADPDEEAGLAVAVGMGRRDEVWKPTLQVFRPDGTPAAFVKVGLGPVGDQLVATEATTLAEWARFGDPRLVVPDLIADTTWNGLRIAVVAPLPEDVRRLPAGAPSAWAVRQLDGPEEQLTLADSPWWKQRRAACADQAAADRLLDRIAARHDDGHAHRWARWHGDWVPWNLARCHRGLVAWDWEYSETGAPVGLDEVHGAYQHARVVAGRPIADALAAARATATRLASTTPSPASPERLRARAGADTAEPLAASPAWLADLHVAMLVTRSAELERLLEHPPADQAELLTAATNALGSAP